jgi:hypothetical protein
MQNGVTERPVLGNVLHYAILISCIILPWVFHFTIAWWAGIVVFFVVSALYKELFTKGSLCMGVPFLYALWSFAALLLWDVVLLVRWFLSSLN